MALITSQTPLTTVRKYIDTGSSSGGKLFISNHSGGAVVAKVYMVPTQNASSTIADHMFWIISCPANSTVTFSEHCPVRAGSQQRLEAEAASNSALVLSVIS